MNPAAIEADVTRNISADDADLRTGLVLHRNRAEPWQRSVLGMTFVENGYRLATPSVPHCLRSLTYIHNETVNIYSHALGALLLVVLPIYMLTSDTDHRYRVLTTADALACIIYFLAATACFLLSVIEALYIFCTKLHSLGLILLLWGANIPLIYYGLHCSLRLQIVYWTLTSLTAAIFSISLFWLSRPCYMTFGFQFLALSILIPVVHGLITFGLPVQVHRLSLQWVIYALIGLTFGTAADAIKFPEMFFPGAYDTLGASHQITHIALLVAAIVYSFGVMGQFDFVHKGDTLC